MAGGGPFTTAVSQRLGALLAYGGQWLGLSPNKLTALGLTCYVAAAALYAFLPSGAGAAMVCLLVYQLAYGLDCSDGQLARAQGRTSAFGGWWDVTADAVSSLCLAFALLYWLSGSTGIDILELLPVLLLATGRIVVLYSTKFTENGGRRSPGQGGAVASTAKRALWLVIDTPTLLLLVCLLRDFPEGLTLYIAIMGLAYCANAAYLGLTKLPRE